MHNNLPTIKQDSQVILGKSNSLIKITNKILATRSTPLATALQYKPFVQMGNIGEGNSIAFSPDGSMALSGSDDKTLKLWDISRGKVIRIFKGHTDFISSVAFSPDGQTALSGSWDNTLKLWDISTGKEIRTFEGYNSTVVSIAFSPDGQTALSEKMYGHWDGFTLFLWNIDSGDILYDFNEASNIRWVYDDDCPQPTMEYCGESFNSVTISPDGKMALTGSSINPPLKLWNISSGAVIKTFHAHTDPVYSVAFSLDGKTALSGSEDRTVKLWDIATGREIRTFKGHTDAVRSVTFSPDGKKALSGSCDETLKLWDISTGKEIRTFKGHTGWVGPVIFSSDGKTVLSGSSDKTLKLWDIDTGEIVRTMITFRDGEWIAITPEGYFDHSENGRQYLRILMPQKGEVAIDDATYNYYYRPNGLLDSDVLKSNLPEIDINEDEIPF